jgi:hypothetical protein
MAERPLVPDHRGDPVLHQVVSCAQQTPAVVRQSVEEWLARSSLR